MTIHTGHPFADPEPERDPVRRLRGRLASGVTLWTSGTGRGRAGLTVSSMMVAAGEPARVLALIDPDSALAEALAGTGLAVVQVLSWQHRQLAGMFAGTDPAPGGAFRFAEFTDTEWGPALADASARAGVRLESQREVGWSVEVSAVLQEIWLGPDDEPLVHRRGGWLRERG